jgi:uncharacterized iron-regulated membrane protein
MRIWQNVHRYLGVFIGIQLLFWTLSGLIFSFSPIEKVRGEHLIRSQAPVDLSQFDWIPLQNLELGQEESTSKLDVKLLDVKYRVLLDQPIYEITTSRSGTRHIELRDGLTGGYLTPVDESLAKEIALNDFAEPTAVRSVERIEQAGPHSEYRGRELPAYRVELDHDSGTVIYVSEARGAVVTRRNTRWRWFDFFWMLHTMDYQSRDNFNHWPLQVASLLGVSTVLSGFGLFITRTRWFRRRRRRRNLAAA